MLGFCWALSLSFFWFIIKESIPKQKWLIIPISWLVYSLSTWHSLIYGYSGVVWFLSLTAILGSLYFQQRIKESYFFIIPVFLLLGFVSSFSYSLGLLVWPIGLLSFNGKFPHKRKLLSIFVIAGILAFALYFNGWKLNPDHPDPFLAQYMPLEYVQYVITYLGNGVAHLGQIGLDSLTLTFIAGTVITSLFVLMNVGVIRFKESAKLVPWIQIGLIGLFAALITGIGRLGFGTEQALSSRYFLYSTMFLIGTLGLSSGLTFHLKAKEISSKLSKSLKIIFIAFLILLIIYVLVTDIVGWLVGVRNSERHDNAAFCLVNYRYASDVCLKKSFPNVSKLKEKSTLLRRTKFGAFCRFKIHSIR